MPSLSWPLPYMGRWRIAGGGQTTALSIRGGTSPVPYRNLPKGALVGALREIALDRFADAESSDGAVANRATCLPVAFRLLGLSPSDSPARKNASPIHRARRGRW